MNILVDLDGVIRDRNSTPISTGIQTIGALSSWNKITLMTELRMDEVTQWLDVNKVIDFDLIIDSSIGLIGEDLKHRQITFARSKGGIDLVITSSPHVWVTAFEQGITALMFGHPSYLRPEFRPDAPKERRSWDQIVEAIEKQNAARSQDARLTRTEALNFGD